MLGPHQISTVIQAMRFKHRPSFRSERLQIPDEVRRVAIQNALDELALEFARRLPVSDRAQFLEDAKRKF